MPEGSSESDRIKASPRKIWVPGVQACATAGISTSARSTASATLPAVSARDEARGILRPLDPDALTLPPYRFPEIVQLFLHDIVDCIASSVDVIPNLFNDVVDGNTVDELLAAIHRCSESALGSWGSPACTFDGAVSSPSRSFEPTSTRPPRAFDPSHSSEGRTPAGITNQWSDRTTPRRPASQQQRDASSHCRANDRRRQQVVLLLTLLVQIHFWV